MRKIIWLPIENLEERYSSQWNQWFKDEFDRLKVPHIMMYGQILSNEIRQGSFLDVVSTNYFKANQLKDLCWFIDQGYLKDKDIILVHDGWFPGIEMLAYIRDALDLKFEIYGIFHAGTYDPYDFLSGKGMEKWGANLEKSWFQIYDGIFVATEFHKEMILKARSDYNDQTSGVYLYDIMKIKDKICVTGLPIYPDFVKPDTEKANIIVFPHRLDPEKQPDMFDELALTLRKELPDWAFVKTKTVTENKKTYYKILNQAKISVSCALQETWGIAMIESVMCGCIPVVPDRLSYKELYPGVFRYDSFEELKAKVKYFILNQDLLESLRLEILKNDLIKKGAEAIQNMVDIMIGE